MSLLAASRDPITVYIDSPGGSVAVAQSLRRLLTSTDQDGSAPCRLITAVTSQAASAAADFLTSGDYAIAYPGTSVYFHGVRTQSHRPITAVVASGLTESLKNTNDQYASNLAKRSNHRFFFRYVWLKRQFVEVSLDGKGRQRANIDCFATLLSQHLSWSGQKLLSKALTRNERYRDISRKVLRASSIKRLFAKPTTPYRAVEAAILREITSVHEKDKTYRGMDLRGQGLVQITDDFLLLSTYIGHHAQEHIERLAAQWGEFLVDDFEAFRASKGEKRAELSRKMEPHILPIWLLFAAICHSLQEGEHDLTAEDAYWLGLIDEVIGSDLPNLRLLVEGSGVAAAAHE